MSFWKYAPGPSWWDCIESLNPCVTAPYGICNSNIARRERHLKLEKEFHIVKLEARHASEIVTLLKDHFTVYPRCRISLSKERIKDGFEKDDWIGVGVYTIDKKMIGCCVSKALGRLKFTHETIDQGGVVDYFCVHANYRKKGLASFLLDELVHVTAQKERFVHVFLKEGFPVWSLPPLYSSQYIARKSDFPDETKSYYSSQGISLRTFIKTYSHADYLPLQRFAANLPYQLNGDSELTVFNYKGHTVFLCVTDLHHKTVPEGQTIGELSWILPQTAEVPLSIQTLAVETCVDSSKFDIILMDSKIPHDVKQSWKKDATYSWYIFNYNPGAFFSVKPFWIF